MKRIYFILAILIAVSLFSGCTSGESGKIIAVSNFPAYDAVRAILGSDSDIEIKLLLLPGTQAHDYDPSAKDIIAIRESLLFVYNGGESDEWAKKICETAGEGMAERSLTLMSCTTLLNEDGEEDEYDEHVWTSPVNMIKIVSAIADRIIEVDSENEDKYIANRDKYIGELNALDAEFRELLKTNNIKPLVFGDRFPFKYFAAEYNLEYHAAFPGCSHDTEPSASVIARLEDIIKTQKITTVFYIELSTHVVADSIARDTGSATAMLHSAHNVTRAEFEAGATYISLMKANLEVLKNYIG